MRFCLLLFCALAFESCRDLSLAGTSYSTGPDFVGDCYYFKSDSTFESRGWTCLGGDTGAGHYRLTKDSLIFYYETLDAAKGQYVEIDSVQSVGDSCVVSILCRDQSGPLIFVYVIAESKARTMGTITDTAGAATIRIAKADFPVKITFSLVGYQRLRVDINNSGDCKLNVKMRTRLVYNVPPGTVHAYRVKKLSKKEIRLAFEYVDSDSVRQTARTTLYRVK